MKVPAQIFATLGALAALSMAVYAHSGVREQNLIILVPVMSILGAGILRKFPAAGGALLLGGALMVRIFAGSNLLAVATLVLLLVGSGFSIAAAIADAPRGQRAFVPGRVVGWLFIDAGALVLLSDSWATLAANRRWAPVLLGQLWYNLDPSSLNLVQAVIQRYLSVILWNDVLQPILLSWAFAVLFVIGLAFLIFCAAGSYRARKARIHPSS